MFGFPTGKLQSSRSANRLHMVEFRSPAWSQTQPDDGVPFSSKLSQIVSPNPQHFNYKQILFTVVHL